MLLRSRAVACAPIELAEAKVTVGDQGDHAAWFGEHQRLAVVALAGLGVEAVRMGRDGAEQMQRVGSEPRLTRGRLERTVGTNLRLVEPVQQQTRATQCVEGPAVIRDKPRQHLTLEEP